LIRLNFDFSEVLSLGRGPYDHILQPLQGGSEFVVTPLSQAAKEDILYICNTTLLVAILQKTCRLLKHLSRYLKAECGDSLFFWNTMNFIAFRSFVFHKVV